MGQSRQPQLFVRNATKNDIKAIQKLVDLAYPSKEMPTYAASQLRGQMSVFPEGQFVAVYGEEIVGYMATFVIDGEIALRAHTWKEVTGGGYASTHDPDGDWLYGGEPENIQHWFQMSYQFPAGR